MKISDIYASRWIKVSDLGDGKEFTIKAVAMEEIRRERESKPVASFKETESKLVLNPTNLRKIAELTGLDDTDDWPGQRIRLVRTQVPFGPDQVDAIRVEPAIRKAPVEKLVRKNFTKFVEKKTDEDGESIPF